MAGDKYTYRDLDDFTDTIQRSLKTLPIVSKVERSGVLNENVFLNFSQERLAQYKLKPADLPNILAARNLPDSGQTLNAHGRTISVSTTGEFKSIDDLRNVMIGASPNGTPLYLRDLVDIDRGYESPRFVPEPVHAPRRERQLDHDARDYALRTDEEGRTNQLFRQTGGRKSRERQEVIAG